MKLALKTLLSLGLLAAAGCGSNVPDEAPPVEDIKAMEEQSRAMRREHGSGEEVTREQGMRNREQAGVLGAGDNSDPARR